MPCCDENLLDLLHCVAFVAVICWGVVPRVALHCVTSRHVTLRYATLRYVVWSYSLCALESPSWWGSVAARCPETGAAFGPPVYLMPHVRVVVARLKHHSHLHLDCSHVLQVLDAASSPDGEGDGKGDGGLDDPC